MFGINGAGLTNLLGLRLGRTVVEVQMEEKQCAFFRNMGALMEGVWKVPVFANGTRFNEVFEGEFYFDGGGGGGGTKKRGRGSRKGVWRGL